MESSFDDSQSNIKKQQIKTNEQSTANSFYHSQYSQNYSIDYINNDNLENEDETRKEPVLKNVVKKSVIGQGSSARVYKAYLNNEMGNKYYALKQMHKSWIIDQKQLSHLQQEINILKKFRNPFLGNCVKSFSDATSIYLLQDYYEGGQLFDLVAQHGRFNNDVALFYIAQLALAINYLHVNNIMYRDLKPENIVLDQDGYIKLIDFGYAKEFKSGKDKTFTLCGTPQYIAPEIIKCFLYKTGFGKEVDLWALGIITYQLLSGCRPFCNEDINEIYMQILKGDMIFPEYFTKEQKYFIVQLLNPNENERLGSQDNGKSILKHKWLKNINLKKLYKKEIKAPIADSSSDDLSQSDLNNVTKVNLRKLTNSEQDLFKFL